ncbi:hypothetical protein ACWZEH_02885 [Streptomyces sp. QTS137]
MRSARMLLATATATAALVVSAPTAFSAPMGDWEHDKSSYSKEHDKDSSHDKPHGGVHTGGGALAAVGEDGWSGEYDKEESKDESKYEDKDKHEDKDEEKGREHGKPSGGVHTGGGALAAVGEDGWSGEYDKEESKDESKYEDKDKGKHEDEDKDKGKHEDEYEDKGKHEDKDEEKGREHGKPSGGVHTGGGALAAVDEDGWSGKHDKEESKDESKYEDKDGYGGKKDWEHEKPSGGMHTGGGGLSDPSVSGGGLAALAVLGAGAYALRRKKASGSVA